MVRCLSLFPHGASGGSILSLSLAKEKEQTKKEKTLVYGERGQPFARQARKPLSFRLPLTNGDGSMGKVCAYTNSAMKKNSVCAFIRGVDVEPHDKGKVRSSCP